MASDWSDECSETIATVSRFSDAAAERRATGDGRLNVVYLVSAGHRHCVVPNNALIDPLPCFVRRVATALDLRPQEA